MLRELSARRRDQDPRFHREFPSRHHHHRFRDRSLSLGTGVGPSELLLLVQDSATQIRNATNGRAQVGPASVNERCARKSARGKLARSRRSRGTRYVRRRNPPFPTVGLVVSFSLPASRLYYGGNRGEPTSEVYRRDPLSRCKALKSLPTELAGCASLRELDVRSDKKQTCKITPEFATTLKGRSCTIRGGVVKKGKGGGKKTAA